MKFHKLILLTAVCINSGCTLREVEPPSQGTVIFRPATSPDIVLLNFRNSIIEYNIDYYIRCFTDIPERIFVFVPSDYFDVFSNWDVESERRYFQNLGKPLTPPSLNIFVQDSTTTSDSASYILDYDLNYPHRKNNISCAVQGKMWLYLSRSKQGLWSIYKWKDMKTITDSTWSYLKANI